MSHKPAAAAIAALLVLSMLIPVAVAVPDARLSVSDVTVTPSTPVTGAPVTVDVTVSNGAGSPDALVVDEIRIVEDDDVRARTLESGSLSAGGTLTVPLTMRFSTPGTHDLLILVRARDENNERVTVRRPLSLAVEQAPPLVELNASEVVVSSETPTPVLVSNPTTDAMRNVVVSLSTGNGEAVVARRTIASLAAGASRSLNLSVRAARAGDATLTVTVNYTTGSGTHATETYRHSVEAVPLDDDVGVRIDTAPPPDEQEQQPGGQLGVLLGGNTGGETTRNTDDEDAPTRVTVTVTNFGNTAISNVVATPRVGETTLPRVAVPGPLAPGTEEQVTVSLERAPAGTLVVDVGYDVGTDSSTATGQFDFRRQTGAITLTGVDLTRQDGVLRVTGNAGNVGDGPVTGLVVAVGDSPGVESAYPQRDYFIGTVEGSEFAPFELTARADETADTVAIVVSYAVDGERREERVELPISDVDENQQSDRNAPLSLWLGIVGVALVAGAAAVVVRTR